MVTTDMFRAHSRGTPREPSRSMSTRISLEGGVASDDPMDRRFRNTVLTNATEGIYTVPVAFSRGNMAAISPPQAPDSLLPSTGGFASPGVQCHKKTHRDDSGLGHSWMEIRWVALPGVQTKKGGNASPLPR